MDGFISQGHQHPATNNVPRTHPARIGPDPSDGATSSDFLTGDSESPDEWRPFINGAVHHCQRKLGWLLEVACHGYELLQSLVPFEPGSAGLNEGRLYKLLGDLEWEGLTRHLLVRQKGLPHRNVLSLTRPGKSAFYDWLQTAQAREGPVKNDFFLRDPFPVR
jgi:DNA-binding PadR family transcriptional regulator